MISLEHAYILFLLSIPLTSCLVVTYDKSLFNASPVPY